MRVSRVSQETEVACVRRERDQAAGVGRGRGDDVDHLHVPDVVDVEALLEADHQPAPVHPDRPDLVVVRVAADLRPLLEVAHAQGPGVGGGHHGHEAGAEQTLGYVDIGLLVPVHQVHGVRGVDAVQAVAPHRAYRHTSASIMSLITGRKLKYLYLIDDA